MRRSPSAGKTARASSRGNDAPSDRRSLREYERKRDFSVTPEPSGRTRASTGTEEKGFSYVIQKHRASHLHYDFRLELDGVLLSWAVPKGPSLDPAVKRLAMPTEDHPLDYGSFEGTIPAGEYGGGTVMVWDRGSWAPEGDARASYAKGNLTFTLHGDKLRGRWHLVRSHRTSEKRPSWILFKSKDAEASTTRDVVEEETRSAKTGRTLDEIAEAKRGSVWHSNRDREDAAPAEKKPRGAAKKKAPTKAKTKKALPALDALEPEEAKQAKTTPAGAGWSHEPRFDGLRAWLALEGGKARVALARDHADATENFPHLCGEVESLDWPDVVVDGEITALRADGRPDSDALAEAIAASDEEALVFYAFDLVGENGEDLRRLPFEERKARLERVLGGSSSRRLRYVPHTTDRGADVFAEACRLGLGGVISKKTTSAYRAGANGDWVSVRCGDPKPATKAKASAPSRTKATIPASKLTHPEKILWPDPPTTKADLARYYELVAERMLPHVAHRPLTLVRCPNGIGKQTFFQKHATEDLPKDIVAIDVGSREKLPYMMIHDPAGLRALVQRSVLEIHTWGCHDDAVDAPDWWVFDLDPDVSVPWKDVVLAAHDVRARLAKVELESWVKTTGGKGLHVCVPVAKKLDWDETKALCGAFANAMVHDSPARYVATITKAARRGKILVDFFRNGRGATAVSPYSSRARDGGTVAMPLAWKALDEGTPPVFTVQGVLASGLARVDPWKDIARERQSTKAAVAAYLAKARR